MSSVLSIGLLFSASPQPLQATEKIYIPYGPLNFSLSVASLETFAETGEITPEFQFYARLMKPQLRQQFRQILQRRFKVSAFAVSQYTYTPLGEAALQNLGQAIQTEAGVNGFYAMRSALILAANDPQGLSLLGFLKQFPTRGLRINAELLLNLSRQLVTYFNYRDAAIAAIDAQMRTEATTQPAVNPAQLPDLTKPGPFQVEKRTLDLTSLRKARSISGQEALNQRFEVDLFLPQGQSGAAPVIVFSHGLGAYRSRLGWLLEHLASYGFAVLAPEHPSSDLERRQAVLQGLLQSNIDPIAFLERPTDIKVALDGVEQLAQTDSTLQGRLDLQRVGIIGNSLGAQTALAVSGAEINYRRLRQVCNNAPTLNGSLVLQCLAKQLPVSNFTAREPRIKAVVALHPPDSAIFGPESIAAIQIPTLIAAGTNDILAPVTPEQIYPFTWLKTPEKYLALMVPSGHIFADPEDKLSPQLSQLLGGPDPLRKRTFTQVLSIAFFQVYLNNRPEYRDYLTPAYAQFLSSGDLRLDVVRSLTEAQIEKAYGGPPPLPVVPPLKK